MAIWKSRRPPACFINSQLLSGAQPPGSFMRVIEEELARVR
jgi:hypothetical protein